MDVPWGPGIARGRGGSVFYRGGTEKLARSLSCPLPTAHHPGLAVPFVPFTRPPTRHTACDPPGPRVGISRRPFRAAWTQPCLDPDKQHKPRLPLRRAHLTSRHQVSHRFSCRHRSHPALSAPPLPAPRGWHRARGHEAGVV